MNIGSSKYVSADNRGICIESVYWKLKNANEIKQTWSYN
jgi:hypothetical protein